jgi:hypothetical protein
LSFKHQFQKIERSDGIVNLKSLFGVVGETKVEAQAEMAEV